MSGAVIALVVATIGLNVLGQLLLKVGAGRAGLGATLPLSLVNGPTVFGALCFVAALGLYVLTLQRLPLVVAQSLFALQFAAVIVAAVVVLGERVSLTQGVGIALIAVGVFLAARV